MQRQRQGESVKRPKFTEEQEEWICEALGEWYLLWKCKMTNNHEPHYLGIAKEQLKKLLCGQEVSTVLEDIVRELSDKV